MNINFETKPPYPYLLALGFFLVFAGVRLHFIMAYASQTPYWDDWGMGYRMSLYMESGFDPTWLYGLTNEHRAMFSKLTNFMLFQFNDQQWDPYLTMVLDAFMWAAIGVFMICLGFSERSRINPWLFALLVIALWTYPLSLFNTLSTIQTYLYYMIIFVVCGFWFITNKIFSFKWCVGVLFIGAACMTAGGGSFAPVAAVAVSCFMAIFGRQNRSQHIVTAAVACIFAAFGLYLILIQGSSNPFGSKSLSPFLMTLFKTLSWPSSDRAWPSLFFLAPIFLLALGIAFKKIPQSRVATYTLMMAAFGIMIAIAIAYARGYTSSGPAERYFDFLTIYLLASALSLMLIVRNTPKSLAVFSRGLVIAWVSMCLLAIPYHLKVSKFQLNDRAELVPIQDDIMARYSVNGDAKIFDNRKFREVPFPRASTLQDFMQRLVRTDTLPYTLQPSKMSLQTGANAFTENGIPNPNRGLYRGLEHVLGTFDAALGGQTPIGEYTSEVFTARRPFVMIPVSGDIGRKGVSLFLVGETNGKVIEVLPKVRKSHRNRLWREILVKAPDSKFRIVAKDESSSQWLAYAAPRSVGRLSYIIDRVIQVGKRIWSLGLLLIFFVLVRQLSRSIAVKRGT